MPLAPQFPVPIYPSDWPRRDYFNV